MIRTFWGSREPEGLESPQRIVCRTQYLAYANAADSAQDGLQESLIQDGSADETGPTSAISQYPMNIPRPASSIYGDFVRSPPTPGSLRYKSATNGEVCSPGDIVAMYGRSHGDNSGDDNGLKGQVYESTSLDCELQATQCGEKAVAYGEPNSTEFRASDNRLQVESSNIPQEQVEEGEFTSAQESVEILSSMSRRALRVDDPDVLALVQRLDGLPLALATTGSYLDQVTVSVAEYLNLYESSWLQLHENDPGLEMYADRTLYSTWRVSLDRIEQQNELSARLLGLWCYFANEDLWFELVRDGLTKELPWLHRLTSSFLVFTEAMRVLCNYGLAEGDTASRDTAESRGYSVHACVHSWTIHVLNKQWDDTLADFAVRAIGKHVPSKDTTEPWAIQRRLLQHAERCLSYLSKIVPAQADMEESLHYLGDLFSDQGKMKEAEEIYLRALRGYEEVWGPKHLSTLDTLHNLGIFYTRQGNRAEAEKVCLRAIEGYEHAEGEHEANIRYLREQLSVGFRDG